MRFTASTLLLATGLSLAACQPVAEIADTSPVVESALQTPETVSAGPIPGPRTCFWSRGPHSADPYINIAYPDANVYYWAATFTMPEGSNLKLEGEYPHARYMSLISYDQRGRPVESLSDYLIEPGPSSELEKYASQRAKPSALKTFSLDLGQAHAQDAATSAPGASVNPFIAGNPRNAQNRNYAVKIINKSPETERAVGERAEGGSGNVLHAPAYSQINQQMVLYRIYLPDDGAAPTGGVLLPEPVLTLENGDQLRGDDACHALKTRQPIAITTDAVGIPPVKYRKLINQPGKPDTWPSKIPAEWYIQLDRESLLGIYTGYINPDARRSEGGFYPNLDNHYVRTIINRKHGPIFMLRGKAPTTPKTFAGQDVMGDGELRYWSICANQGFANTRVNDCLFDEEIPLDANGFYTVLVSRAADRPRNAIKECGIGWLPMAEDGDGLFDPDVTVVQIRHMLTAQDFDHSVQRVMRQDELENIMGSYLPQTRYALPNQIETFFPCLAEASGKDAEQ